LLPRQDGTGRIAAIEILKSTMRTREYVEKGESEGKSLLDAMRDGSTEGMQHFDGVLDTFIREGFVDFETRLASRRTLETYASNCRTISTIQRTAKRAARRPPK